MEPQEPESVSRNFLKVLVDPDNAQLDVVAVHGLNYRGVENHAEETWTAPNGKMWLRDFLPTQLPHARILLFGYNANTTFTSSAAGVDEQAQNLLNRLKLKRKKVPEDRPVMFICYSLGGIIVKRALVDAKLDKTYEPIRKLCYGIVFFGTPHQGGNLASLGQVAGIPLQNTFVEAFTKDSLYADNIINDCRHQLEDRFVLTFFETQAVKDLGIIVDRESATLGLPGQRETRLALDTDHENICKFCDCDAPDYEYVSENIQELAEKVITTALRVDPRENTGYTERIRILTWLSDIAVKDHHAFISSDRLSGTGKWLLEKQEFIGWKESASSSILWLHGVAGAGKSKLASLVIDQFRRTRRSDEALAYFYCNYKEEKKRDPEFILREIVKQLSVMRDGVELPNPLVELYRKREKDGFLSTLLRLAESQDLISGLVAGYKQTIICIDALDECHKDTRKNLLFALNQLLKSSTRPIKIFVTSRDDHDIKLRLEDSPNVYIRASDNTSDINRFVETEVERCISRKEVLDGNVTPDLKAHIIKALINGAHGMFLWADMQIRGICRERTAGDIEQALERLPKDLDETFSEILERIEKQPNEDPKLAKKVLQFILCAQRPLSFDELISAVSITPGETKWQGDGDWAEKDILDVCQNLIVIDKESGVLRFAHLSVQDFLGQRFESSHVYVAETCLTLLCWPNHEHKYDGYKKSAFTEYSTIYWGIHSQLSENDGSTLLIELQRGFLILPRGFKIWCRESERRLPLFKAQKYNSKADTLSPLLVACHYSLLEAMRLLLDISTSAHLFRKGSILFKIKNGHDSKKRTMFHYAAAQGHERIIKELLEIICRGVGLKVPVQDQPVSWLTKKALSPWVNHKDYNGQTPLFLAAENGHEGVVKISLQAGVDVNYKDNNGNTPLNLAAVNGHEGVVKILLQAKADFNCNSPLTSAARSGHEGTVKLLLQAGADVNCKGSGGETALYCAASNGHEGLVKLLLQAEADVNCKEYWGGTPLYCAASSGHEGTVKLLLQAGADVNCKEDWGATPLYRAASNGHEGLVKLLLQAGADVNCKENWSAIPLHCAASSGHEGTVKLLLQAGADVNYKRSGVETALYCAARSGHEGTVKLLLQAEADVNCKGSGGETALYCAASNGHEGLVKLLLQAGADVNCKEDWSAIPLHCAASSGHEGTVKLLLQAGADVNCKGSGGETVLHCVASSGHEGTVKLLLQAGADVNCKRSGGETALHCAASNGHEGLVKILLQVEADVNCKASSGETALYYAARSGHEGVVKLLLQAGADVNCKDNWGATPLRWAARSGHEGVVKILLQAGVDANCKDNHGWTPLHWATRNRHEGVIKLFGAAGEASSRSSKRFRSHCVAEGVV